MPTDDGIRADLLRGLAEASARLDRGSDAIAAASEAARLYTQAGREADAALARYWMGYGLYQSDNEPDARSVLLALLEQVRAGLQVEPDFEMRLLTAMAAVESRSGPGRPGPHVPRGGARTRRGPRRPPARRLPLQPRRELPRGR
jgi:hypothetical protein